MIEKIAAEGSIVGEIVKKIKKKMGRPKKVVEAPSQPIEAMPIAEIEQKAEPKKEIIAVAFDQADEFEQALFAPSEAIGIKRMIVLAHKKEVENAVLKERFMPAEEKQQMQQKPSVFSDAIAEIVGPIAMAAREEIKGILVEAMEDVAKRQEKK